MENALWMWVVSEWSRVWGMQDGWWERERVLFYRRYRVTAHTQKKENKEKRKKRKKKNGYGFFIFSFFLGRRFKHCYSHLLPYKIYRRQHTNNNNNNNNKRMCLGNWKKYKSSHSVFSLSTFSTHFPSFHAFSCSWKYKYLYIIYIMVYNRVFCKWESVGLFTEFNGGLGSCVLCWRGSGGRHIKNVAQGMILLYSHSVGLCFDT